MSGQTTLTVTDATLVSIEVSPATPSIANGLTQQFTATGRLHGQLDAGPHHAGHLGLLQCGGGDGEQRRGSNGLATTAGVGSTTVSATAGEVSGETTLTVTDATLVSIEVSPAAPSIANGLTQQFTATGRLHGQLDAGPHDAGHLGLVRRRGGDGEQRRRLERPRDGGGVGSTTVSATAGEVSGETTLTVTDATLVSIEVSPAAPSIANGLTQQFTATGVYTDDSTQDLTTQVTWASSDAAVATVSNAGGSNGLATTAGAGSTTVSATVGEVSGDDDVDGDRRDPGVDRGVAGGPEHRERPDPAVHGDRPLHGQLDAGPHDAGHLGLVRCDGRDGEQRRRLGRPRDHGRRRQHDRLGDQRRRERRARR